MEEMIEGLPTAADLEGEYNRVAEEGVKSRRDGQPDLDWVEVEGLVDSMSFVQLDALEDMIAEKRQKMEGKHGA